MVFLFFMGAAYEFKKKRFGGASGRLHANTATVGHKGAPAGVEMSSEVRENRG